MAKPSSMQFEVHLNLYPPTMPTFYQGKRFLQPHISTGRVPMASGPCPSWGMPSPIYEGSSMGPCCGLSPSTGAKGDNRGDERHSMGRAKHREVIPWKPQCPHAPAHKIRGVGEITAKPHMLIFIKRSFPLFTYKKSPH